MRPARFVIVGSGWRSQAYLKLAAAFPERFQVSAVVTRTAKRGAEVSSRWGVTTERALEAAVSSHQPDFVLVVVPWVASPDVVREAVALGVPVLTETPPAVDATDMVALWSDVGNSGLVQVAEQYPYYPGHTARRTLIDSGVIGTVSSVYVASTHGYHAMALIRSMLGVGFDNAVVRALRMEFPLAHPITRDGQSGHLNPRLSWNVLAHLDFGEGRYGIYDFTDNQWHNPLRMNRIVIRGSLGEIDTDRVVHATDIDTIRESFLLRRQTGIDMDFEGLDLDHIAFEGDVVARNRWVGGRLADDEIATATLLGRMADWVRGSGPAPYPLADACQDHLLSLTVEAALASGGTEGTTTHAWADARYVNGAMR